MSKSKLKKLKVYFFEGLGRCDYTCGDFLVVARSVEEAKTDALRHAPGLSSTWGGRPTDIRDVPEPEELSLEDKFMYIGPGSA